MSTTSQLHLSEQFSSIDAISVDIANVLEMLAYSRLSDSGEDARVLSQFRGSDLGAWNRL